MPMSRHQDTDVAASKTEAKTSLGAKLPSMSQHLNPRLSYAIPMNCSMLTLYM